MPKSKRATEQRRLRRAIGPKPTMADAFGCVTITSTDDAPRIYIPARHGKSRFPHPNED